MLLTNNICQKLAEAAWDKSRELGVAISFAMADQHGLPLYFQRFDQALVLSTVLVPQKAYTAAITQTPTKELAVLAAEGGPLMGISNNDANLTLVAGGHPLFVDGAIVAGFGVGGGTETQDEAIVQHVLNVYKTLLGDAK